MYSLNDILSYNKKTIIRSVVIEHSSLDITNLRLILVSNLRLFNMLDTSLMNITNDPYKMHILISNNINDIQSSFRFMCKFRSLILT